MTIYTRASYHWHGPVFAPMVAVGLALAHFAGVSVRAAETNTHPVSYNAQVRPLLSDKCFRCHGPDQRARKGKLRLDQEESALGQKAIVPGRPEESSLIKRIFSADPKQMMPPPDTHKSLSKSEKDLLAGLGCPGRQVPNPIGPISRRSKHLSLPAAMRSISSSGKG